MRALILAAIAAQWTGTAPRGELAITVSATLETYVLAELELERGELAVQLEDHTGWRSSERYPVIGPMLVDVERELVVSRLRWCGLEGVDAGGWA